LKAARTEVVVRDKTRGEEVFRVDLVLGSRWLVFEVETNEAGGEPPSTYEWIADVDHGTAVAVGRNTFQRRCDSYAPPTP